ncbi:MAG TPA: DUF2156 domain-containing protein [Myxococcota bacterium]|mgnify:FL=1|nr:DUF2156 domain-containing protein [Myxococcota bacterium]HQK50404.1 DUF2156 domain-containing protein [Myxococcota bacterium]
MTGQDLAAAPWAPFRPEDRDLLAPRFRTPGHPLCEYTFATQFCWQGWNHSLWALVEDFLFVRYVERGRLGLICPCGSGDLARALDATMQFLEREGHEPRVDFVPASVARQPAIAERFVAEDHPDDADYWYRREDLAELPGRRYADKRNHIARFLRAGFDWRFEPACLSDPAEAMAFLQEWCRSHDCQGDPRLDFEVQALGTCLAHREVLGQRCWLLRVDGRVVGLVLGEFLDSQSFVVHYEKAFQDIPGAYAMLVRETARALAPEGVLWIDREQDMGIPGLRRSKQSWNPVRLEMACVLRPR